MDDKELFTVHDDDIPEVTGNDAGKIIEVDINREMRKSFLDYSMSVITSRALPDVRDGLKPVHRRILYTMYENGLSPDKAYRKCADTVGSVLGRYHPHGDASVYDAMVRLAQDFSMRYCLVDGHGNFGSIDGDPPAAYRYTESRMSKMALEMLANIDEDTVDFQPNYDDRLKEPVVLPSRFPNLLVNGSSGIAVGMATNIPPHNLTEVVDAIDYKMQHPDAGVAELSQFIKGPDFPTGGIIMGQAGIRAAYATGKGKITLRAVASIEETGRGDRYKIVVTELPYQVNKARLIESIADLVREKKIDGISDINDYSSREGMNVVIDLKRDANPQIVLNSLYRNTQLQVTYGIIMLALVNGEPKVLSLPDVIKCYIDHQEDVIIRRTRYRLKKAQDRAHIVEALLRALDFIDEIIDVLRNSPGISEGRRALEERFGFDEIQSDHIVKMRLGQLTGLERKKLEDEYADLSAKIDEYNGILSSRDKVHEIIRGELEDIKTHYGDERRTQIQAVSGEIDIEDLIPNERCVVTLTRMGYIKRMSADEYKLQNRGGRGVKGLTRREDDVVTMLANCMAHDYLMFFTSAGKVYKLLAYEVAQEQRSSRGRNIVNILQVDPGENVTELVSVPRDGGSEELKYLVFVTDRGIIKRCDIREFDSVRKNGLRAVKLEEDEQLVRVLATRGNEDLLIATRKGKAIRFNEEEIRCMGRTAHGVRGIRLQNDDAVVGAVVIREGCKLLTLSEDGFARQSEPEQYSSQARGGQGRINYHCEKYGFVAGVCALYGGEDLIIIASNGVIIRIPSDTISTVSRTGKGVRVMRPSVGEIVVAMSAIANDEAIDANEDTDGEIIDATAGNEAENTD